MRPPMGFEQRYGQHPELHRAVRRWLPVVVSLILQVPAAIFVLTPLAARWMPEVAAAPWRGWVALVLAIVGPLALLLARRYPGPVVAFVTGAAAVDVLVGPAAGPPFFALAFALVLAVVHGARLWAWISIGVAWIATLGIAIATGFELKPLEVAFTTFGLLLVMGIAEGARTRRERYAEFRRATLQRRTNEVQAERVRIARELHDVLAHSLSQINVQAGVGLHLMDSQPGKAAEALASIKETSKTALDEVRSVLGVLRSDDGEAPLVPEPGLERLPGLVASVIGQGLDVSLHRGIEDAPKPVQLAIFRIVQESLTNVLRHSGATRASVDLDVVDGVYLVTVGDNGSGFADEEGRGLLGMRERAELLGGTLETGRSPAGGAEVRVRIPVREGLGERA